MRPSQKFVLLMLLFAGVLAISQADVCADDDVRLIFEYSPGSSSEFQGNIVSPGETFGFPSQSLDDVVYPPCYNYDKTGCDCDDTAKVCKTLINSMGNCYLLSTFCSDSILDDYKVKCYFSFLVYETGHLPCPICGGGSKFCIVAVPESKALIAEKEPAKDVVGNPEQTTDPVNIIYGNMSTFPQHDFTLTGINEPLQFYRTYNSQSEYDGPFGYGWTHSYNVTLINRVYSLQILDEEGKSHFFEPVNAYPINEDGSKLTKLSGARFLWETADGKKYHFDEIHKQVVVGDPPVRTDYYYHVNQIDYKDGSGVSLTYSGTFRNKYLTGITDTHGRTITLQWSNGRITDIIEPGRPVDEPIHYEYDGYGNLIRVDYPVDDSTTYQRYYVYANPADQKDGNTRRERQLILLFI